MWVLHNESEITFEPEWRWPLMSSCQDISQPSVLGEEIPAYPEQGDRSKVYCLRVWWGGSHLLRSLETCESPAPPRGGGGPSGWAPGLMPTLWCPAGGCLNVPEMGPIYTQKFSKGFGSPEVKALLGDNSQSTHDPFLRKSHLKIRKGN